MKLTVLVDNNSLIDQYLLAEPAVSYLLETKGKKILFDCGYSDVFLQNALNLNEDLLDIDTIVLSHGHDDHVGGLQHLLKYYDEHPPRKRPQVICHPLCFNRKEKGELNIGCTLCLEDIQRHCDIRFSKSPLRITDNVFFLGEIERGNDFENQEPIGVREQNGIMVADFLPDDTALAYKSKNGLVVITGCSHAGICNIISQAKKVCNEEKIADVLGGFHLLTPSQKQVDGTVHYFNELGVSKIHPCHCTNLAHKIILSQNHEIGEIGAGLVINYD